MTAPDPRPWWHRVVGWLAVIAMLAMGWVVLALGLVVPSVPHALIVGVWVLTTAATALARRVEPLRAGVIPLVFAVAVVAVVWAGGTWWGWSA